MAELFANLGINWKLLLAQAVNFLLVLWVLNRFVFKKLLAYLDERKARIAKGIETADRAKRELQRVEEMRHREIVHARRQGEAIVEEAKKAADTQSRGILLGAKEREEQMFLKARDEAQKLKEDMVGAANEEIREKALRAAEKILARAITPKDEERFLKEALQELS